MTRYMLALAMALLPFVVYPQSRQQSSSSLTTYTSDGLGFSYTYPVQLVPNTADFRRKLNARVRDQDQEQSAVLLSAFETLIPGKAREGVVITAEDVALYGGKLDARDYLRKATMALSRQGWTVLRENMSAEFDGQQFLRADYQHTNPPMFQSVVCTIRRKSVLEFIFSAGSEEEVNQLLRSLGTLHFQGPNARGNSH
jgi:hypothetical protein